MKRPFLNHFIIVLLALIIGGITPATAEINKKFYRKAAETVWSMNLPPFNPAADLSDSLYQNQSAVFIARYIGIDASYNSDYNPRKESVVGIPESNITDAVYLRRYMVKLNDAAAVDKYTEFTMPAAQKETVRGYTLYETKPAFGARIIKPDGTVKDVDIAEALTVTAGKKGKDAEYRIAIPGLTAGDILEYFYYTIYTFDEFSVPSIRVPLLGSYPTKNLTLDCQTDPKLALEYGAYNGAPKITAFSKAGDKNKLFFELEDVDMLDDEMPCFSVARQMPFIDIHIKNNNARLEYVPETARPGGIRHTSYPFLMSDIASSIVKCKFNTKVVNDAASITKIWMKANKDATTRQIADAAWISLSVALVQENEKASSRQFAVMFSNLLKKLNLPENGRIGVTTSRKQVPVTELVDYNDADYVVFVGDVCYIADNDLCQLPGEIPAHYDGEAFVKFDANPDNPLLYRSAVQGNLPKTKAKDNVMTVETHLRLDPDNEENILASTDMNLTGAMKSLASLIPPAHEQLNRATTYLGHKPVKIKDYDTETEKADKTELAEKLIKQLWDSDDAVLSEHKVLEYGCTPDSAALRMNFKGSVSGLISQGGNNLIVGIGHFIASQKQFKGKERERDVSIVRECPEKFDTSIIFHIPEGYELVENSLDDLNRSVVTPEATFNTQAISDGHTVTIRIVERYPRSLYAASSWASILKVQDAAHEFNTASLILRPL